MWIGGVRVVILDEQERILMLRQEHEGKSVWMVPGGGIEGNEDAKEAAVREVFEETGLEVEIDRLIWHVEEVSKERGQRFVNFFQAHVTGGELVLGSDPEREPDAQVMREIRYMTREEICDLQVLYPEYLKDEIWQFLTTKEKGYECFKRRKERTR
ncbi:MAG: NUDIX hydrolase [Clostridia bacterium]|nr:NUDIX hydrolase [Clostridia bacterium]